MHNLFLQILYVFFLITGNCIASQREKEKMANNIVANIQTCSSAVKIIVLTARGELSCIDSSNGDILWSIPGEKLTDGNLHEFTLPESRGRSILVPSLDGQIYEFLVDQSSIRSMNLNTDDLLRETVKFAGFAVDGNVGYKTIGVDPCSGTVLYDGTNPERQATSSTRNVLVIRKTSRFLQGIDEMTGAVRWSSKTCDVNLSLTPSGTLAVTTPEVLSSLRFEMSEGKVSRSDNMVYWEKAVGSHIVHGWLLFDNQIKQIDLLGRKGAEAMTGPAHFNTPLFYLGTEDGIPFVIQPRSVQFRQELAFSSNMLPGSMKVSSRAMNEKLAKPLLLENRKPLEIAAPTTEPATGEVCAANGITIVTDNDVKVVGSSSSDNEARESGVLVCSTVVVSPTGSVLNKSSIMESSVTKTIVAFGALATALFAGVARVFRRQDEHSEDVQKDETSSTLKKSKNTNQTTENVSVSSNSSKNSWKESIDNSNTRSSLTLPNPASPDLTPKTTSKFHTEFIVKRKLGAGAFGVVYEAVHKTDQLECAVKRILLKSDTEKEKDNVFSEVRAMAKLDHSGLVRYYQAWVEEVREESINTLDDSSDTDNGICVEKKRSVPMTNHSDSLFLPTNGCSTDLITFRNSSASKPPPECKDSSDEDVDEVAPCELITPKTRKASKSDGEQTKTYCYIVLQLCDKVLTSWLQEHPKSTDRPERLLKRWARQLLSTLKYLHGKGMIHRDIKPANIMLKYNEEGEEFDVKIGDFGLVSIFKNDNGKKYPSNAVGTRHYWAPEMNKNKEYKTKVDIYAVGLILLEYVASFTTNMEKVDVFMALKSGETPKALTAIQDLQLRELIGGLIKYDPDERLSAIEALALPYFHK